MLLHFQLIIAGAIFKSAQWTVDLPSLWWFQPHGFISDYLWFYVGLSDLKQLFHPTFGSLGEVNQILSELSNNIWWNGERNWELKEIKGLILA